MTVPPRTVPRVSAVVLAYGAEPLLGTCVDALLASSGVHVDVVLVDNGCTSDGVQRLEGTPGLRILRPSENTGFAGGCNLGVAASDAELVVLVNSDAIVTPTALARLAASLEDPTVGLATASLRLDKDVEQMNSAGNPVHFLGLSWAGSLGEPAADHVQQVDVASASGAAVGLRRDTWDRLGGFWGEMFAYCEDTELSLRCWQLGLRVVYVPDAVVVHHYEFSRNPVKMYLLERNRLLVLLTLYERRTLLLLLPAILGLELLGLLVAARQGWARDKMRGWWWLLGHRRQVAQRRRLVQGARLRPDREVVVVLTAEFEPGPDAGVRAPWVAAALSRGYWRLVRALLA